MYELISHPETMQIFEDKISVHITPEEPGFSSSLAAWCQFINNMLPSQFTENRMQIRKNVNKDVSKNPPISMS